MLYVTGFPRVFKAVRLVIRDQPRPLLCQDLSLRPSPTGFAFQFLVTPGQAGLVVSFASMRGILRL